MNFSEYVEASELAEGLFGSWFKKKPTIEPDIHVNKDLEQRYDDRKTAFDDVRSTTDRFKPGNLFQALNVFNRLHKDVQYSPTVISRIAGSNKFNLAWDQKYRPMFLRSVNKQNPTDISQTPQTDQMFLNRAFREIGLPPPQPRQNIKEPTTQSIPSAIPLESPKSFNDLVDFIKGVLNQDRSITPKQLKEIVIRKYPGLDAKHGGMASAYIGKAMKKATRPSLLHIPDEEEMPYEKQDILKFPTFKPKVAEEF